MTDRYQRQLALSVIGAEGQRKLAASAVVVVGCGALGSRQAELMARAGVGCLTLIDRDRVELHNLPRQTLFDENDARERLPKAQCAARHLRAINSQITIEAVTVDVTAANVEELLPSADVVLDGTDNFETRYLLNDVCVKSNTPWIYGGLLGTVGGVMAVRPGIGPCLRCVFPEAPQTSALATCETRGVLNAAVAWVAALQVTEALKILVGDPPAQFRLYGFDIWKGSYRALDVTRSATCPCCGQRRFDFLGSPPRVR
jgi:molybdopterin/thiamine biosynthesis adenylyltransferase